MNTITVVFLCTIVLCIGVAIGSAIERILGKRSPSRSPATERKNNLADAGDVEILSAWRTSNNQVWLEMDGQRLGNRDSLQPEQRQRLLNLVLDLRPWLDAAQSAAPKPTAPAQAAQPDKDRYKPLKTDVPHAAVPDSIIQQIDQVLQAELATSELKDRKIQLMEGPGGVVIVKDGSNSYEGIDTIPDPKVKDIIRRAVTDWEKGSK